MRNSQNTVRKRRCSDNIISFESLFFFVVVAAIVAAVASSSLLPRLIVFFLGANFNIAADAPNTVNAALNAPPGVDVTALNVEDAADRTSPPPRGMERWCIVDDVAT